MTIKEYETSMGIVKKYDSQVTVSRDGSGDFNCDGTDDNIQIQQAIDSIAAVGGIVFIRKGVYDISASITLPSNIHLTGEGNSSQLVLADTTNEDIVENANQLVLTDENIEVSNLYFDGNRDNQTVVRHCVGLHGANYSKVHNNYMKDAFGDGVYMAGCTNIKVYNNTITNSKRQGISCGEAVATYCSYIQIYDNLIFGSDLIGIDIEPASFTTIRDNYIVNGGTGSGSSIKPAITLRGTNSDTKADFERNVVMNNYIYNWYEGIIIRNQKNFKVSNNYVNKMTTNHGIYMLNNKDGEIIDNTFIYNNKSGIEIQSDNKNLVINNNVCKYNMLYGISANGSYLDVVNNNVLNNNVIQSTNAGIAARGTYLKIENNSIYDNQLTFITDLSADITAGTAILTVVDSSIFYEGQHITLSDDLLNETADVLSIDSNTQITLSANVANSYTTANNALITGITTQHYGIRFFSSTGEVLMEGNYIFDNVSSNIKDIGFATLQQSYHGVEEGAASPSSTPAKVGDIFIDSANGNVYISKGTASSADWVQVN